MIIDCIGCLHGYQPDLEAGDLLIVAGDLTAKHTLKEVDKFNDWIRIQDYRKKIVIGGNHDTFFERGVYDPFDISTHNPKSIIIDPSCDYLCDSEDEFEGMKIWGSPWTKTFPAINPHCKAFTVTTEEQLAEKWELIPDDIDILITHCPPYGIFDSVIRKNRTVEHTGSKSLRNTVMGRLNKLKVHIFAHIHEHGGKILQLPSLKVINVSLMNEFYMPTHKPVRIFL